MGTGILDTVGLMAAVVFAVPVAFLGVDFLLGGKVLLGAAFLAIAVLMVAVEEYVTTPRDVPAAVAGRVAGAVAKSEPEDRNADADEK